jgi:hypothetical protein
VSEQSERYLDIVRCNTNVALTCVSYLSSDCFDLTLSDDDVRSGILCGAYALESYAASHWLQHVRDAMSQSKGPLDFDFCHAIYQFIEKRQNPSFKPPTITYRDEIGYLDRFGPDWPMTSGTLKNVADFFRRRQERVPLKQGNNHDRSTTQG